MDGDEPREMGIPPGHQSPSLAYGESCLWASGQAASSHVCTSRPRQQLWRLVGAMKNAAKAVGSKQHLSTETLNWGVLWELLEDESKEEGIIFHPAF